MKKLSLLLLLVTQLLNGNTYYVSTTGNDANAGTISAPWATWNYGFNQLVAGDTLYIRGGTYQPIGTFSDAGFGDTHSAVSIHNTNGTAENRIVVMGYPGERVILDGVNVTQGADTTSRHGIKATYCDYWTLRDFEVTGFVQLEDQLGVAPIQFQEYSDNNEFIGLKIYENGGSGIRILYDCNGNLIYNCDSWLNYDHLSVPTPGNNSDGFEIADITDTTYVNTIRGCRAWDNSDDGIDLIRNEGVVYIDSTWCFYNGVTAEYNATGFKLGGGMTDEVFKYRRFVTNCMAIGNVREGFVINGSNQPKMKLYNNLALWNYYGFEMYTTDAPTDTSVFRNNISYANDVDDWRNDYSTLIISNNNYDADWQPLGPVCDSTDFVTLDTTGLRYSRKSNGCLPDIQFAKLTAMSDMINAGVDVGTDYRGAAPDLGPFEYVGQVVYYYDGKLMFVGSAIVSDAQAEIGYADVLADGNTLAWYDFTEGITKSGGDPDLVSSWADQSGNSWHLTNATEANQPSYSSDGVAINDVSDYLRSPAWSSPYTSQPIFMYIVFKQRTGWADERFIFSGSDGGMYLKQDGPTDNQVRVYAGSSGLSKVTVSLDTWHIARILFNGANSKLIIDNGTPVTGDAGSQTAIRLYMGDDNGTSAICSYKEIIVRNNADSAEEEALIYAYLTNKHSL